MSKKHFEAAAAQIRSMYELANSQDAGSPGWGEEMRNRARGAEDVWVVVAEQFNDRFDSVRFRQACRP